MRNLQERKLLGILLVQGYLDFSDVKSVYKTRFPGRETLRRFKEDGFVTKSKERFVQCCTKEEIIFAIQGN